ncbi:Holliday junction resolvase RuvX [Candidatus Babeliales bacterium]|nr:Holliday junction resolvase RuvX [Candidatus Babeliales bacterium]
MKCAALDVGDVWTGIAISDRLRMIAQPHTTVTTADLESYLKKLIIDEDISTIVVGLPKTLRGTESEQTKKTITYKEHLEKIFPTIIWTFWDERLSSKQASVVQRQAKQRDKKRSHAIAAAVVLQSYLESQRL